MANPKIRVDRATDDDRYLTTDEIVWFAEPGSASTAEQLVGVPVEQRFAADSEDADRDTYPGIYGVRPMQLAVPDISARAGSGRPSRCQG